MDTNLTLQGTPENDRKILTGLSTRLIELLKCSDGEAAKSSIASDAALLAEARAALPALRRHANQASGADGVKAVIGRRFVTYPQGARSDGEWVAWWADYTDALSDLPRGALEAAMKAWVARQDSKFLPMPGELRALARQSVNPAQVAYDRAYFASVEANGPSDPYRLPKPEPTPRDREAVRDLLADYTARMEAKRPAPKPSRSMHGPIPEGKLITAELQALIDRRKAAELARQEAEAEAGAEHERARATRALHRAQRVPA